jgi:hypothetical protein
VAKIEDAIVKEGSDTIAAFVVEPIMVVGGFLIPPRTYFPEIKQVLGNVMDRSWLGALRLSDQVNSCSALEIRYAFVLEWIFEDNRTAETRRRPPKTFYKICSLWYKYRRLLCDWLLSLTVFTTEDCLTCTMLISPRASSPPLAPPFSRLFVHFDGTSTFFLHNTC